MYRFIAGVVVGFAVWEFFGAKIKAWVKAQWEKRKPGT